jgi:hypothetical protein
VPDDYDVYRLWAITVAAEHWHVLPSVAARDLDDDPQQLALVCRTLSIYAQAKAAFDTATDDSQLEAWKSSELMTQVQANAFAFHKERTARRKKERATRG